MKYKKVKDMSLIGNLDVSSLQNKMQQLDWNKFTFRQDTYDNHRKTLTVPLIYDKDFRIKNPTQCEDYLLFKEELKNIEEMFKNIYGDGYIIRALLVKLLKKSIIPKHVDQGESLSICRRVHIPIVTNTDVFFSVNNKVTHMKYGQMWEINNLGVHSVINNSEQDRIHLIVDWIENDRLQ